MIPLLFAWLALAQEAPVGPAPTEPAPVAEPAPGAEPAPVAESAPTDPADDVSVEIRRVEEGGEVVHEVIVHGDLRVEAARREVIEQLRDEGYTDIKDMGDYMRLRNDAVWKGEIRVYDDGWVHMKRQPVRFIAIGTPWAAEGSPGAWIGCVFYAFACVKPGGQLLSRNKLEGVKGRVLGEVDPEAREFADAVADRETDAVIETLPARLEALWRDGTPLSEGDLPADTYALRKDAILLYWETRTDTPWGDRVRLAVEAFVRGEVQGSDHAFTPDEVAAFNGRRTCTRALDLESPWEVVAADIEPSW